MIKPKTSNEKNKKILEELLIRNPTLPSPGVDFSYKNLEIEPGKKNKWFYFNKSLEALRSKGYERHPFSAEVFALICAYLDDKKNKTNLLSSEQTEIVKDMLTSYGEWFCQAIKTEQNSNTKTVKFYELVTALPTNQENKSWKDFAGFAGYDDAGLKYSGQIKEFDISDLKLNKYNLYKNIHQKHDDLIVYTHSRKFNDLPEKIKEVGGIHLPDPGNTWPAGRGYDYWFDIETYILKRASRGVRAMDGFAWSPDRTKIAFSSTRDGNHDFNKKI